MKRLPFLVLAIVLFGCATTREATWKTAPEANIPYDRGWTIIVNAVGERFDLETVDAQSGYLRSGWKTTDTCWAGLVMGGKVPCRKTRVIVRVEERSPFKIKVKVEKEEASAWTNYQTWAASGNDEQMEREIMEDLLGRLRR